MTAIARNASIRHAAALPAQRLRSGSLPTAGAKISGKACRFENGGPMAGPGCSFQLHAWEACKAYGGEIHAAEAFTQGMPANTPSA